MQNLKEGTKVVVQGNKKVGTVISQIGVHVNVQLEEGNVISCLAHELTEWKFLTEDQ